MTPPQTATVMLALVFALGTLSLPADAQTPTPAEVFAKRVNNLDLIPEGWITTRPIQLAVSFNLKSAPNSAAANAFLKRWHTTMQAMPEKVDLKLHRHVTPKQFQYTVTMTFKNWADYMSHEKSDAFMQYYRAYWKPEVTEAEERLSVIDDETTR